MTARRGQNALEYLVTYGWVMLAVLIVIGALAYFGVINPGKWVASKCDLGSQLECADYYINSSDDSVNLYLRNKFGKDIEITDAVVLDNLGVGQGIIVAPPILISAGDVNETVISSLPSGLLLAGEKQQLTLKVTFQRAGTTNTHTLTGTLFAEVN